MRKKQAVAAVPVTDHATYQDWLDQAEICRDQARIAVGLKRFKAARGLFSTAIALCRQAIAGGAEAKDRLRQLDDEMSAYAELSKSMEKPLVARANSTPLRAKPQQLPFNTSMRAK